MRDRQAQMRNARLEIIVETSNGARDDGAIIGPDPFRQIAGDGARGRLIAGSDARLKLWPQIGWDLRRKIAHAMCETTLARRTRKAFFDRANNAGRAVGDDEQRIAEPASAHMSWKKARTVSAS